jgi:hypothetical protein
MTGKFDFTLTQQDINLTTDFMMLLGDKEWFSSDDFRLHRLHLKCRLAECAYPKHNPKHNRCKLNGELCRHVAMQDPAHEIGAYFARLKANGLVESPGDVASRVASNNRRKVDLLRWNWKRWRVIVKSQLTEYTRVENEKC